MGSNLWLDFQSLQVTLWFKFTAFLVSLAAASIVAMPTLKLLVALKSRQEVYALAPESHQKKQGTPTMGGIIIILGLVITLALTTLDWWLILWILGFALIGFADDFIVPRLFKGKRGLGWKQKIAAQLVLAVAAAPVFHVPWNATFVIAIAFLVLFFANAYNFADGLDGLAGTLGLLLCAGFIALACIVNAQSIVLPLTALAAAFIPFLFLNAPPAKVFMGDVGSLPIGALFGASAAMILIDPPPHTMIFVADVSDWRVDMIFPLIIASFVMIAELIPVPMQVGYYKLTKKRLFPMTPIHHSFEVKGWPESRVVWCFALTQLVLVAISTGLAAHIYGRVP